MSADQRLVTIAQALLDNLAFALTTAGIDVPTRQYITSGEIAQDIGEDCDEAFVVSWSGLTEGVLLPPGGGGATVGTGTAIKCAMPLVAQFTVFLLRCVPTLDDRGIAPTVAQLQTSGEKLLLDAMTLPAVTVDTHLANTLLDSSCTLVGINTAAAIGPFGGIGGTTMTLLVDLT